MMTVVFQSRETSSGVMELKNVKLLITTGIIDKEGNEIKEVYDIFFEDDNHIELDISKWKIVHLENKRTETLSSTRGVGQEVN